MVKDGGCELSETISGSVGRAGDDVRDRCLGSWRDELWVGSGPSEEQ